MRRLSAHRVELAEVAALVTLVVAIVQGWGVVWVILAAAWLTLASIALVRRGSAR